MYCVCVCIYIYIYICIYTCRETDSSLGGALNAPKFPCAQRDSLSEIFL